MNSTHHTGAAGELLVCAYFISHGLEVFRNVAPSGPADIVVRNGANFLAIDVKSLRSPYTRTDGTIGLGNKCCLRDDGVWVITYIHGEAAPRLPEGFWEALGMETA